MKYYISLVFLLLFTVSHLPAQTGSTLAAVSMADANNGIAVGFSGTILRTVNGGSTWAPQTSGTTNNLYSVDLSSTTFGTTVGGDPLFGGGRVLRTSNGGVTWSTQSSGTSALLLGISLPDANNGTAVGNNGAIIHTTNAGTAWISQISGTSNHLYEVQFVDANNGFISGSQGTVLRTVDGGATWTKQTTGTPYSLYGVAFVSTNVGTIVGDGGVILRTVNAGSTWASQASGTTTILRSVSFVDANNGVVVGDGGAIRWTTNGGTTWLSQTSGTPYSLNGVYMIDPNTAIAVGYNSLILKTTNSGQTWVQQTISSGSPPTVPVLVSPVNGSINQPLTITLSWNVSSGATSYHLQVSSSSTFSTLLVNDSTLTITSRQVTSLANNTIYYWRVNAKNNYGTSGYSTASSFLTLPVAPLPPTLTAPSNGATGQPTTLTLSWNASSGASTYRLQVSTSSTFATTVVNDSTIATTSKLISGLSNSVTHYWRVNAKNAGGTSAYSGTWSFATATVISPPSAPTLVSPSNGAIGQPTTLTLSWNASSGASTYRLQVSTSSTFATTVVDDSTLATTSRQVSGLANTTTYYWRVNAKNAGGTSAYSGTWNFATVVAPPAAPTLLSPSNGATGQATTLTLSWNASSGASTYRLQVSTSSTFVTTIVNDSTIATTSKLIGGLSNSVTYYWRVNAKNAGGTSAYSGTWNFATVAAPPAAPTLLSPSNGAIGQPTTLTLSWNASSGASTYRLQVSTSSTFATTIINDSTLATTLRQVSGLSNTTTYYWRVNAKNAGGTSAYSSTWSFATATVISPPSAPTLVSPSNGATGQSTTLTLSWNVSSGASTYRLQVSTSSTFSTTIVNDSTLATTSKLISGLSNSVTYYWRVNAKNAGGTSAYSGTWSFITSAPLPPVFSVTPTSIDFGTVAVGVPLTNSVTVTNTGGSTLTLSSIVSTSAKYTVSPTSGSLVAGASMTVNITFTPTNKTTTTANINFTHNAAGSPSVVTVSGKGGSGPKGPRQPSEALVDLPLEYELLQNYPNPFNPVTIIEYQLPEPSIVQLEIYNSLGQQVVSLIDREVQSGYQAIEWSAMNNSGNPLPSGIYYYRIHAISEVSGKELNEIRKMILMK